MNKLIEAFKANPNEKNRNRLQQYLYKHVMAICMASTEDKAFLASNGFKV